jgi:hypothetical protein
MGSYSFEIDLQFDLPLDPLTVMLDMHERFQRSGFGEGDEYELMFAECEYEHYILKRRKSGTIASIHLVNNKFVKALQRFKSSIEQY